jgi:VanZ family protein
MPSRFILANRKLWLAALVVYWLTIFAATHAPSDFPGLPSDGWDKLVHFSAFAVLGALVALAWPAVSKRFGKKQLLSAWIAIAVYAALDEWTQSFVGRDASVFDWLADAAGAAVGLAIANWLSKKFARN